jgi:hypothetical protein
MNGQGLILRMLIAGLSLLLAACDTDAPPGVALAPNQMAPNASAPSSPGHIVGVPPASAVTIFAAPTPQEYVSLGASTNSAGDGYNLVARDARLTSVLLDAVNQPRIRYNAAGYYEVELPGASWDPLIFYKGLVNASPDNSFFQPSSYAQNFATFIISRSRLDGYRFSELASWTKADRAAPYVGHVAFGEPTPPDAVPTVGRATFVGSLSNMVDITDLDYLYGGYYFIALEGTITLTADFAARTLSGTLALEMKQGANEQAVGIYAIAPIALASGSNRFSGLLVSDQSGYNAFEMAFTGPAAEESIGALALPLLIDGQPHQLLGAWIAKHE